MVTTICFDFGNTRLKYAVFENDQLKEVKNLERADSEEIAMLLEKLQPQKTILSSVINHDEAIEKILAEKTSFHKLSHLTKLNFTTPVAKPETIGADRLALVAAAVNLFPGKHNLVIALGTCITYNYVNKYHEFIGGSISPGMDMRFKSLQTFTAKLPLVKENWNFPLIGYDTTTNILSGVQLGMAKEIDGIAEAYAEKYTNFNVVLTGGNAQYFVPHLKTQLTADPDLLFKGLYALSEANS
ncbi:type III pantothenate kinase [Chitinophagaceae bacterium 26-R-25]|nr:type III pantothenate kinase [Chitinophagaceae bacterium 26-R-25]